MSEDGSERRRYPRLERHGPGVVKLLGGDGTARIQLMNLSDGGAKFVSTLPFEPGQTVRLAIDDIEYYVRIHRCTKLFEGYSLRAEFLEKAEEG